MTRKATYPSAAKGAFRSRLTRRDATRRSKQKGLARVADVRPSRRNDLLPKVRLVDRDPRLLVAPERNVRCQEPAHVREVANSAGEFGFTVPVLIDGEDQVIDGIVRVEAAKLLNLPTIPCIVIDSLTPSQIKHLRIAVNKLGEKNEWNLDNLKLEFEELIIDETPIEISGFDKIEIDGILAEVEPDQVEQGPLEPEPGKVPITRLGDVFLLGTHRVVCGDATDPSAIFLAMKGEKARMVFTDQPYNVRISGNVTRGDHREFEMGSGEMSEDEFLAFNDAWMEEALAHLKDGGLLATFIDWRGLHSVTMAALSALLSQINLLLWNKTNAGMGSQYRSQHELVPLFKKGEAPHVNNVKLGKHGRWRSNVLTYAGASSIRSDARRGLQHHPTVKPVVMLADILLDLTNRGDIVLDPFLGSGSTLIAAEKTGRVCRGVEIDPLYVDVIVRRFEKVTGKKVVLEATEETFAELQKRRESETASPEVVALPVTIAATTELASTGPVYRTRTRLSVPGA